MINGTHVIIYTRDAAADRAFIRDTLGFPGVDAGDGWLIFKLPPAEIAIHPTDGESRHELYLMCEDIASTLQELAARRRGRQPRRPSSRLTSPTERLSPFCRTATAECGARPCRSGRRAED